MNYFYYIINLASNELFLSYLIFATVFYKILGAIMIESYRNIYSKLENIPSKYITAKQLSNLKSLGINTIYDLIYYFPRAYDDRTRNL